MTEWLYTLYFVVEVRDLLCAETNAGQKCDIGVNRLSVRQHGEITSTIICQKTNLNPATVQIQPSGKE